MTTQMQRPQPQAQTTNGQMQVAKEERAIEYVPFGGKLPIKLTLGITRNFVAQKTKSGKLPSDTEIFKFMMLCQARMLNPFEGDAYLVGYDGNDGPTYSLITAHQAFLKRAESHPAYDGMDSGVMVCTKEGAVLDRDGDFFFDGEEILGAWAIVYRKDRSHPTKRRLKLSVFNKGFSRWKVDPAGMIVKCAESDALRSSFPTLLAGMYIEEEMTPVVSHDAIAPPARPQPPTGRQSLRQPAKIVPTTYEADYDGEVPNDAPEREPGVEDDPPPAKIDAIELEDMLRRLRESVDAAASRDDLGNVQAELARQRDVLGKANFEQLAHACKAKAELMGKAKAK